MRVCRFGLEEMVLIGFYADTHVIPIDQAAEAYRRAIALAPTAPERRFLQRRLESLK